MCIYVDDDGAETLDSGERRARKQHKCGECRRMIEPGELYQFWVTLYDGNFSTQKMCSHCWATIDVGAQITGCPRNWYWGFVFETYDDDGAFVGDIIHNHELTRRQTALMRLCSHHGKRSWRRPDGSLHDVPRAVGPLKWRPTEYAFKAVDEIDELRIVATKLFSGTLRRGDVQRHMELVAKRRQRHAEAMELCR